MEQQGNESGQRVRQNTAPEQNSKIDQEIKQNLKSFSEADYEAIDNRIEELDKEWDVERTLELNAAVLALTGAVLAITADKRWVALPVIVGSFLIQHAIQGWCPPLPLFRKQGFRTRPEIDREKYGLKALRGDFRRTVNSPNKAWAAVNQ
jgi:hypothetical protein